MAEPPVRCSRYWESDRSSRNPSGFAENHSPELVRSLKSGPALTWRAGALIRATSPVRSPANLRFLTVHAERLLARGGDPRSGAPLGV